MNVRDLQRIQDLLQDEEIDEEDSSTQDYGAIQALYGPKKEKKEGYNKPFKAVVKGNESKEEKAIWEEEEVPESAGVIEQEDQDDREQPEYEILYKQSVGAQDVYMNMGFKDPSSMSCDQMVIKIKLPGEPMAKVKVVSTGHILYV